MGCTKDYAELRLLDLELGEVEALSSPRDAAFAKSRRQLSAIAASEITR